MGIMGDKGTYRTDDLKDISPGELVAVRSLDEILATLDADAKLDGLPFMPEMVPFCGRSFRVHRRAEKTCVEGIGMRSMADVVLLKDLRCDGSAHDGCQRGCLFFWKKAWLKAEGGEPDPEKCKLKIENCKLQIDELMESDVRCGSPPLSAFPFPPFSPLPTTKGDRFYCQSTELAGATSAFSQGKLRNCLHDLRIGEMTPRRFALIIWIGLTNRIWRLLRGRGFYQITGQQRKTLSAELNLQPGELVEIKSAAEIEATLDSQGRNRGLSFEPEMARHCGRRYRVTRRCAR